MIKSTGIKRKWGIFDIINVFLLIVASIAIIYPFYNSILISLVSQKEYVTTPFMLWPKSITLDSYKFIFSYTTLMNGFFVTSVIVVFGVVYNMFLTLTMGYALSKKNYPGQKFFVGLIVFTMYFGGGLIPFYLLVKDLHLINNIAAMIIPTGINTFYMIIIMNFFRSLPQSLEESAKVDGANELVILFKIMLPLSLPILATFFLFYSVDRWNEWWFGMLFIKSSSKQPLQLVLRSMISTITLPMGEGASSTLARNMFQDGVKMASVIVTIVPIMILYPFLQKYFMKGIMIGAIKS